MLAAAGSGDRGNGNDVGATPPSGLLSSDTSGCEETDRYARAAGIVDAENTALCLIRADVPSAQRRPSRPGFLLRVD